jgi:hypothetical protein
MTVLDPEPLDQLGCGSARFGKLLAVPLAKGRSERVDLTHGRFTLLHPSTEAEKRAPLCDEIVAIPARRWQTAAGYPPLERP